LESATVAAASRPLSFRRHRLAAGETFSDSLLIGGNWLGASAAAPPLPLLAPAGMAVCDAWAGSQPPGPAQRHGNVRYATDGFWLHGCAEIDDSVLGLQASARQAYAEIFEVLSTSGCPHLIRLWNYFPGMNSETEGLERYRQFNIGRQEAFVAARRSALEGAPAACALGTQQGALRVYFLAGRCAPVAIENPRQVSAYRYPDAYGPRAPTFSRAALADVGGGRLALFISGTASIVGHVSMHVGDVRRQTEESLANIDIVRNVAATAGSRPFAAGDLTYTIYLRRPEDLDTVRQVFEQAVGPGSAAARDAIYLQADVCRADLLVEIEAHGFSPLGSPL
jgi:chorismate lyase / 3-hydroxybenzoate synthase